MAEAVQTIRTVLDPASGPLAREYVTALLNLMPQNDAAEDFAAELDALLALLNANREFQELLVAAPLSHTQRMAMIQKTFAGRVSETLMGLLSVLVHHERLGLLPHIGSTFRHLLDHRMGKVPVTVTTAVPMDRGQVQAVQDALAKALAATPVLKVNVDENLLGGMVIRVGDRVYDASLQSQLGRMRQALLSRSARRTNV